MSTIKRPNLVKTSAAGKKYITVNGKTTMLSDDVLANWDNIKTIDVETVHYDKGRDPENPDSEPTEEFAFDRQEIVDYETFARELKVEEHIVAMEVTRRKMLKEVVVADKDAALALAD